MCSFALSRFSWAECVDRLEPLRHHRNTGAALHLSAILGKVTQTFYHSLHSANAILYLLTLHNPVNGIILIRKKQYTKFKHVMLYNVLEARSHHLNIKYYEAKLLFSKTIDISCLSNKKCFGSQKIKIYICVKYRRRFTQIKWASIVLMVHKVVNTDLVQISTVMLKL